MQTLSISSGLTGRWRRSSAGHTAHSGFPAAPPSSSAANNKDLKHQQKHSNVKQTSETKLQVIKCTPYILVSCKQQRLKTSTETLKHQTNIRN